ncbi:MULTISPECIES: flagellar protein FliT [Pseudomonas]|uniref:Flagellar protein FliT n=1 Tax=Pseudomonas monteilii TaxID=76759 RepID=A0A7W2LAE7_9PSED|nr:MULTISPECIES: flagellar protein FliT [Pseudomonas]MBA6137285.1 flagellar protein FliT [Pseudomonas monteilii]MCA4075250.1 flagellar protein FliT [Pseudomonas kurunegalensis]MDT3745891.1 flagellar protein FliT [Pseudomonas kurunegalensis]MVF50897.1 flagellar protein FliT [Pseudomonas monteilii]
MSDVIARIEQTRDMLLAALAERNWEAVGELNLECRLRIGDLLDDAQGNEADVRDSLEQLLDVYHQLIAVASGERQSLVDEMTKIRQAKNAAKVYHLFT